MVSDSQEITFSTSRLGRATRLGFIAAGLIAVATPAAAQLLSTTTSTISSTTSTTTTSLTSTTACTPQAVQTRLIEWDINPIDDIQPGALVVDDRSSSRHSKVWFVTRNGETRLYRLTPGRGIKKDAAEAKSWPLGALQTGGVRLRHSDDGRFAFVNVNDDDGVNGALVAVDTRDETRVTWLDRPLQPQMSDVSIDTRGDRHSVFTAARQYQDDNRALDGVDGVVQRLRPGQPRYETDAFGKTRVVVPAEVTRWLVGHGAGTCAVDDDSVASPCIPGITVDRRRGHPIFFSAPAFGVGGAIGELDPRPVACPAGVPFTECAKVRYFPLPNPNPTGTVIAGPRQILVDDHGKVWGITDSGHLFSLEIDRYRNDAVFTIHNPEGPAPEYLFEVAPDGGIVGFTDSNNDEVSVLFPNRVEVKVNAVTEFPPVVKRTLNGIREAAPGEAHVVNPREAIAQGVKYTKPNDGTYVETNVSTGESTSATGSPDPSFAPTGMAPDGARRTGSFFYGVTFSGGTNRVGHFEVKIEPEKELEYRKDDDDYDDDGNDDAYDADDDNDGYNDDVDTDDDNDCIDDAMDKDHDNDGVENEHDSKGNRENKRTDRGNMGPGQSKSYEMTSDSNSLAMIAIVEAATLTTPLSIEVVDPNGIVVLSTPPALGKAVATATPALPGVYTIRVKNGGMSSTTYKTTLIGKSIWF